MLNQQPYKQTPLEEKIKGKIYNHIVICSGNPYKPLGSSGCKLVRAGFWPSDSNVFNLNQDNICYNLDQPAQANIPFIYDVENKEMIILDINIRERLSFGVEGYVEMVKNAIEAVKTKNFISIEKLAEILSGKGKNTSLTITDTPKNDKEIAPDSLFSLFNKNNI